MPLHLTPSFFTLPGFPFKKPRFNFSAAETDFKAMGLPVSYAGFLFNTTGLLVSYTGFLFSVAGLLVNYTWLLFNAAGFLFSYTGNLFNAAGLLVNVKRFPADLTISAVSSTIERGRLNSFSACLKIVPEGFTMFLPEANWWPSHIKTNF